MVNRTSSGDTHTDLKETLVEGTELFNDGGIVTEEQNVNLSQLSGLTGLPIEFLKKELILSEDEISLRDLRKTVLEYLDVTFASVS